MGRIRGGLLAHSQTKEVSLSATITRADGTIENVGEIAYWHRNPLRRWSRTFRNWRLHRKQRK